MHFIVVLKLFLAKNAFYDHPPKRGVRFPKNVHIPISWFLSIVVFFVVLRKSAFFKLKRAIFRVIFAKKILNIVQYGLKNHDFVSKTTIIKFQNHDIYGIFSLT